MLNKELSFFLYDPGITVVNGGTQWQAIWWNTALICFSPF